MKLKKLLAGLFFGVEGACLLIFVLALFDWTWLNLEVLGYCVIGTFLLFLNIISAVVLCEE